MRGNVDTRLSYVATGRLDAVVLAAAGLARLGRAGEATEVLSYEVMLPAPGQGALAVECRAGDDVAARLAGLDHPPTRVAVTAERAVLGALEAGCSAPVGALATLHGPDVADGPDGSDLVLRVAVGDLTGRVQRWARSGRSSEPDELGHRLAGQILAESRDGLLGERVQ